MILLLAGTSDARAIGTELKNSHLKVIATATSNYGSQLLRENGLEVLCGKLDEGALHSVVQQYEISVIVDATHPYAEAISHLALNVAKELNILYLRYERPSILQELSMDKIVAVQDYLEAAKVASLEQGNVLSTIGSRRLEKLVMSIPLDRLFVRILPQPEVIKECLDLGIKLGQIIAMQGPFSKELNMALYKQFNIKTIITKDSGEIGGAKEKIEAAQACGVKTILVERPAIKYPKVFNEIYELLKYLQNMN
ncbi:cobalt-precorrin-6A reductase [Vallitalea okinawensis]|uniref:cobalt-precorrin-6A reductase n=1 Tax=Vallitalea okinawensis TaxID=2078660 RepID=UPI000CFB85C8|nr:cobalt-precorrin-6A reductase [Vallitalea okinawensis]